MRFRIGDIYQLGGGHYIVLTIENANDGSASRYVTLNLEKGIVIQPMTWYADKSGVYVT